MTHDVRAGGPDPLMRKFTGGLMWTAGQRAVQLGIGTLISILLARALTPEDYGLIGMVTAVTGILVFTNNFGLNTLIIRREELDPAFLATVFWLNLLTGLMVAGGVLAGAQLLGAYYGEPRVVPLARVLSATFVINSLSMVPVALLRRQLRFKALTVVGISSLVVGGATSVGLAYSGYGVWSLVIHELVTTSTECVVAVIVTAWRPKLHWSGGVFRECLPFASNMAGTKVATYLIDNIDFLVIGRFYGPTALGLYSMAFRLALQPVRASTTPMGQALFPIYSRVQHDNARLAFYFANSLRVLAVFLVPAAIILAVVPGALVLVLLGDQWVASAPILRLFSVLLIFDALRRMVQGVFLVTHREQELLKIRAVGAVGLIVLMILVATFFGFYSAVVSYVVGNVLIASFQLHRVLAFLQMPGTAFARTLLREHRPMAFFLVAVVVARIVAPDELWPVALALLAYGGFLWVSAGQSLRDVFSPQASSASAS